MTELSPQEKLEKAQRALVEVRNLIDRRKKEIAQLVSLERETVDLLVEIKASVSVIETLKSITP